jgi:hypothetical protein
MRTRAQWGRLCLSLGIFVLLLAGCATGGPKIEATFNEGAALTKGLPENPLQWKVITSVVDAKTSTMGTLYGNETAVQYARTNAQQKGYPDGSTISLVTWAQAADGRWFGANIPGQVKSVEFVSVKLDVDGRPLYSYQKYGGSPLAMENVDQGLSPNERAAFLLGQRAAVMP